MKKFITVLSVLIIAAYLTSAFGGYDTEPGPFNVEIYYGPETSYYFHKPVREVHVTLAEPGTCTVYTVRTTRQGVTYKDEIPMLDENGDGKAFAYSYSPAIVHEVECSGRIAYFRADE